MATQCGDAGRKRSLSYRLRQPAEHLTLNKRRLHHCEGERKSEREREVPFDVAVGRRKEIARAESDTNMHPPTSRSQAQSESNMTFQGPKVLRIRPATATVGLFQRMHEQDQNCIYHVLLFRVAIIVRVPCRDNFFRTRLWPTPQS